MTEQSAERRVFLAKEREEIRKRLAAVNTEAFFIATLVPLNILGEFDYSTDLIGVLVTYMGTKENAMSLADTAFRSKHSTTDGQTCDKLMSEILTGRDYVIESATSAGGFRYYVLAPRPFAKEKPDDTQAVLAKVRALQAKAAAVRDEMREALEELESTTEKMEQAAELLEQAADLISEDV